LFKALQEGPRSPGGSGAASGVENFGNDTLFQEKRVRRVCSVEENSAEVGERVVIGSGNRSGGASAGLRFVREADADVVGSNRDDRASSRSCFVFSLQMMGSTDTCPKVENE